MAIAAGAIFRRTSDGASPRGLGIVVVALGDARGDADGDAGAALARRQSACAGLATALVIFHWAAFSIRGRPFSYAGNDDLPQFVHTAVRTPTCATRSI
jgi:hypothetical protein